MKCCKRICLKHCMYSEIIPTSSAGRSSMVVMPAMKVSFDSNDEVEMHARRGDVHPCAA